jgi:hypothetical protein
MKKELHQLVGVGYGLHDGEPVTILATQDEQGNQLNMLLNSETLLFQSIFAVECAAVLSIILRLKIGLKAYDSEQEVREDIEKYHDDLLKIVEANKKEPFVKLFEFLGELSDKYPDTAEPVKELLKLTKGVENGN